MADPAFPSPESIREAAQEVLADPAYTLDMYEPPYFDTVRDVVSWTNKILQPVFDLFSRLFALPAHLKWPLVALFALVLGLLVWQAVAAGRRAFARRRLREDYTLAPAAQAADAGYWLRQADLAAAAGDYLSALRLLLRAGILTLEGERFTRAATNREYLRRYRGTPSEQPLRVLVQLVDYKWYGGRACSLADWQSGQAAYRELARGGGQGGGRTDAQATGGARG